MAIFADVNGQAQVVSTGSNTRSQSVSDVKEVHKLDGTVERHSHTVTEGPKGQTMTVDTIDKSQNINGTVFHTTQVLSDDGMGHRKETLTQSFELHDKGGLIRQAESVTKDLGAHEAAVDLTRALEDRGTLGVTHDMTLSRTTQDASGAYRTDTLARHLDTVGNESRNHVESVSRASVRDGIKSIDTLSRTEGAGAASVVATHREVSMGRDGRAYEASDERSQSVGVSSGYGHSAGHGVNIDRNTTYSVGASNHTSSAVSHSLEHHLVKHGYSAEEARSTVAGVSESLGHAINAHSMGNSGAVEFHKEGPVAVSLSSGHAQSTGNTIAVSMDELKKVHESGMAQHLTSGHQASMAMQTASNEMSR